MLAGDMEFIAAPDDEGERRKRTRAIDEEFEDMVDYCWDRQVEFEGSHRKGVLAEELAAALERGDLLAVGQKGRMASAGMGSMARSLIKQAPCPVLMASGDLRPIMRILAAFYGSETSRKAVRFARDLAKAADLPFNVLSVGGVTWSADETLLAAQEVAGDAQVLAVGPGDEPEAEQILRVAQHAGLAMIVMGAFPDSWMHQLLFEGTTGQVLRNLNAPVIVVH
jgi:nucleotide-binding universal stress UspA family protein